MSWCASCGTKCKSYKGRCNNCTNVVCNNCLSQYQFHKAKLCIKCEEKVFSNNDNNQHQLTDDQFQIYFQLIEMGFSKKSSIISCSKHSDIESAIQFITEIEKTEQKYNNPLLDEKKMEITPEWLIVGLLPDCEQALLVSGHSETFLQSGGVIILKQNWLEKKSKYLRVWNKRWCVINGEYLLIFENETSHTPEESIQLSTISTINIKAVNKADQNVFCIKTKKGWRATEFRADTLSGVKEWVQCINKYRNSCMRMQVFIECKRDDKFNETAQLVIPYKNDCKYSINELTNNIMNYVQRKHYPLKFVPKIIKRNSFSQQEINFDDYKSLERDITDYNQQCIKQSGMCLQIDISFDHLEVKQLIVYFEIIKKKYQISRRNKNNYFEIMVAITQQIKKNIQFLKKPLNLNMLYFMFVNGFMSKNEFKLVAHELSAGELSQLITNISDKDLSKYVFEVENNDILSGYTHDDVIKLLKKHYSDVFAVFVFKQFKPNFLECQLAKRMKYLMIISVSMLMKIYQQNDIGKKLDISELKYLFKRLQATQDTNKHLEIVSSVAKQIAKQDATFLTLDANNFHFTFYNQLVETEIITCRLTADELTKSLQNINDKNIENEIFLEKPTACLSHYKQNDLNQLLKTYYSDSLAMFVFHQFSPTFLQSDLLLSTTYLNIVSIDVMIWLYLLPFDDDIVIGKCLAVDLLIIYFKTLKQYITTQGKENSGEYWDILSGVTQQIIVEGEYFIAEQDNLQFVFMYGLVTSKNVKEVQIIIHQLKVDELLVFLQEINDKKLQQLIFKRQPKQMLSHYNLNDLMHLLKQYYSDSFAIFVYEQFKPNFLQCTLSSRKRFANIVSVDILIWMYNTKNIGKKLHIDELQYLFNTIKGYWLSNVPVQNKTVKQCSLMLPSLTAQIIEKNVAFITSNTNTLHFVFLNNLVKKNHIHIIVSKLSADDLSNLVCKINDEYISQFIFEEDNQQMLSHFNHNDLIKLLGKHYYHSFAIFVFERFDQFSSKQRKKYLKSVCIDMMIWILDKNCGYKMEVEELSIFVDKVKNIHQQINKCSYLSKKIIEQKGWIHNIVTDNLQYFVIHDLVSKSQSKIIITELTKRQKIYVDQNTMLEHQNQELKKDISNLINDHSQQIETLNEIIDYHDKQNKKLNKIVIDQTKRITKLRNSLYKYDSAAAVDLSGNKYAYGYENDCKYQEQLLSYKNNIVQNSKLIRSNQMQKLRSLQSVSHICYWQWHDYGTIWKAYDHEQNKTIENLQINNSYSFNCAANSQTYKITKLSSVDGTQINTTTNVSRKIRRQRIERTLVTDKYPKWWTKNGLDNDSNYAKPKLIKLDLNSNPAKSVKTSFENTTKAKGFKVIKIESVENEMLFDAYYNSKSKLLKLIGYDRINERELWHGCGNEPVMKLVQKEGFRKEFSKTAKYGKGTYFALNSGYSVNYSSKSNGIYKMFQCLVICGDSCGGKEEYDLTKWPKKGNGGLMYDSLVDNVKKPSIFVIHEDARAYPMFVIHFTKTK